LEPHVAVRAVVEAGRHIGSGTSITLVVAFTLVYCAGLEQYGTVPRLTSPAQLSFVGAWAFAKKEKMGREKRVRKAFMQSMCLIGRKILGKMKVAGSSFRSPKFRYWADIP